MPFSTEMQAALASGAVVPRWLVWVSGRNRSTGAVETTGFWTGDDVQDFTIDGVTRTYYGAGSMIGIDEIVYESGLNVQMQRVRLAILAPEVETAIRGYDPRLAPVEIHLALFSPETNQLIGVERFLKGTIDSAPISEGPRGGSSEVQVTIATSSREGTRTLAAKKSDSSQRERDPTDRGREYADIAGEVTVLWGAKDERSGARKRSRR